MRQQLFITEELNLLYHQYFYGSLCFI